MKYFLLLFCVFYPISGFAQQQFSFGEDIFVRRSNGNFSPGTVVGSPANGWIEVLVKNPDGGTALKSVNLNKPNAYFKFGQEILVRRSNGNFTPGRVETLYTHAPPGRTSSGHNRIRVRVRDPDGREGFKDIDLSNPNAYSVQPLRSSGRGSRLPRAGGIIALMGVALATFDVLKDGVVSVREVQDRALKAMDDALMTTGVEASELHPDVREFNTLIIQMHKTADYFLENDIPMSSRQRKSILEMLDQARDQFSGRSRFSPWS